MWVRGGREVRVWVRGVATRAKYYTATMYTSDEGWEVGGGVCEYFLRRCEDDS